MPPTVIVDYGMGNIGSVQGALEFLGEPSTVVDEPRIVERADSLILPGVGSFSMASKKLQATGWMEAIRSAVLERGSKILGICLGMQLLGVNGQEGGEAPGLGLMPGAVEKFSESGLQPAGLHIGFSGVVTSEASQLFRALPRVVDFYFVHEYRVLESGFDSTWVVGLAEHSERFVASVERRNVFGVQFHPEKSQTNGLTMLKNYVDTKC